MRVVIAGMGGSGTWIARMLSTILAPNEEVTKMVFVDGDHFSRSNKLRQDFSEDNINVNKAEAKAAELAPYTVIPIEFVDKYLSDDNISSIIQNGDIVVSAVDCTLTKRMIDERCQTLETCLLVTLGNELYDGDSQVSLRINDVNITPSLVEYNKDIQEAIGKSRSAMTCEEIGLLPSGGQHVVANIQNATLGAIIINQILDKTDNLKSPCEIDYRAVYFDTETLRMKPQSWR